MELEKLKVKRLLVTLTGDDEINVKDYANLIEEACLLNCESRPRPLKTKMDVSIQEINVDWSMKSSAVATASSNG